MDLGLATARPARPAPVSAEETIRAWDGVPLRARFFEPAGAVKGSVLVVPAMGVPQSYYRAFATWLAGKGYLAATFDYRGMGESLQGRLRDVEADVFTWAKLDTAAMVDALAARAPGVPMSWVGHSLGGQIFPLVPNRDRVAKMVTVATGSGYWRENAAPLKRRVWLLWFVLVPATMPVFGYFPGARLGMIGDLPRGVMAQWRTWCLHPEYAVGVEGGEVRRAFASVQTPITSLSFTDDEFMSAENTTSLHGFYTGAPKQMLRIDPREAELKRIGHFGFFRRGPGEKLWDRYLLPELA